MNFSVRGSGSGSIHVKLGSFLIFYYKKKLLVVVLGPVTAKELVSVEDAPSARFDGRINILTCLWFLV